jgi:hypothetical protein
MKPPRPDGSPSSDDPGFVDVPIPLPLYEALVRNALKNGQLPNEWLREVLEGIVKALKAPPKGGD